MMQQTTLKLAFIFSVFLFATPSWAQLNQGMPAELDNVGVDEKLGETIPLHLEFTTSDGETVTLQELMDGDKPVLLTPMYYNCPVLCGLVLEAVYNVVEDLVWSPGKEYTIISFSIDPTETTQLAASTKKAYAGTLNRESANQGWHFLTGTEESIKELTQALGFHYRYDQSTGEYNHLSSIMLLSPDGVITRYLYGIQYNEFDLRNALSEAAEGRIGSTIDRIILYCFTYDPSSQSYVPVAMNIMKLGGLATVLILGIFLAFMWMRGKGTLQPTQIDLRNE
ncbi:MAG: SCO family protein [Balneolaceae bacterium]